LIANVREQTYIKDFRIFLEGSFKGGIAKIINNSQFTHKDEKRIQLQPLLALAAPPATPDPKSIEYHRIRTVMETFCSKLFELIG
jgi:transposase